MDTVTASGSERQRLTWRGVIGDRQRLIGGLKQESGPLEDIARVLAADPRDVLGHGPQFVPRWL